MKSKSISSHGSATLACVCRCSSGLSRAFSPWIHIFDGLNVWAQVMTPTTESSALASSMARRIASLLLSTGIHWIVTGMSLEAASWARSP